MNHKAIIEAAMMAVETLRALGAANPRITISAGLSPSDVRALAAVAGVETSATANDKPGEQIVGFDWYPHGLCEGVISGQGVERTSPEAAAYEAALDRYRKGDDSARAELCRMAGIEAR